MIFSKIDTETIRYPYVKEWIWTSLYIQKSFSDGSAVKNPPVKQETQVRSPGGDDPWRRAWQPTPVFLSGESHGLRSMVGYSPWGRKESDTTERLHFHVWMWELYCEESWALKNWCFWTVVLEKTLESPLDCKEIQPVYPKGDQSWVFIVGLMLKLKLQYFGHLMGRADLFEKTWCRKWLKAGGEGDDRGWDGWMASVTQWT